MAFKNLRKLTLKSRLSFGKYAEMTVLGILKMGNGIAYLQWIYYNCSMIDFQDEVFNQIFPRPDNDCLRIPKPGTDPDFYIKDLQEFHERQKKAGLDSIIHEKVQRKNMKGRVAASRHRDRVKFSKAALTRRNQGHF